MSIAKAHRKAQGIGGEIVDHEAGLQSGYSWKLEAPWSYNGREIVQMSFSGQCYLDYLGMALVLMPKDQADAICHDRVQLGSDAVKALDRKNTDQARRSTRVTFDVCIDD